MLEKVYSLWKRTLVTWFSCRSICQERRSCPHQTLGCEAQAEGERFWSFLWKDTLAPLLCPPTPALPSNPSPAFSFPPSWSRDLRQWHHHRARSVLWESDKKDGPGLLADHLQDGWSECPGICSKRKWWGLLSPCNNDPLQSPGFLQA